MGTTTTSQAKTLCRRCGATLENFRSKADDGLCVQCEEITRDWQTFTVQFRVAPCWIEDGFSMTDDRALDMLSNDLRYANIGEELDAKVL